MRKRKREGRLAWAQIPTAPPIYRAYDAETGLVAAYVCKGGEGAGWSILPPRHGEAEQLPKLRDVDLETARQAVLAYFLGRDGNADGSVEM
jgi:hypothetical protein